MRFLIEIMGFDMFSSKRHEILPKVLTDAAENAVLCRKGNGASFDRFPRLIKEICRGLGNPSF